MKCGVFMTPYNPPSRTARQVFDWAIDMARICDDAGYTDDMIGEHYTLGWENIPMPEAIIAAYAQTTRQIRFAPMIRNPGRSRCGGLPQRCVPRSGCRISSPPDRRMRSYDFE